MNVIILIASNGGIITIQKPRFGDALLMVIRALCHIYYPESPEQKENYEEVIRAEGQAEFGTQERAKEAEWKRKGKKPLAKRAS
jgi:hypothetical protein